MTEEQNTEPSAYPIGARVCAELAGSFLVCFAIYMICTFGTSIYGLDLAYIVVGTALAYAVVTAMLGRVSGGPVQSRHHRGGDAQPARPR